MKRRLAVVAACFWTQAACFSAAHRRLEAARDLRAVLFLLRVRDEPYVMRQVRPADEYTEAAITQLGSEATPGNQSIADLRLSRPERLARALALLASARQKIAGTDQAAVRCINEAIEALRRASNALGSGLSPKPEPGDQKP